MWAIVGKILFSLAITYLEKSGKLGEAEAWGIKAGTHVLSATKIDPSYPVDKVQGH